MPLSNGGIMLESCWSRVDYEIDSYLLVNVFDIKRMVDGPDLISAATHNLSLADGFSAFFAIMDYTAIWSIREQSAFVLAQQKHAFHS